MSILDGMVIHYGIFMPEHMRVYSGPVNAAYNRQMGDDKRGNRIIGYFNAEYQMFAWSHMHDPVQNIGQVADGWPVNRSLHEEGDWYHGCGRSLREAITLVRPIVEGDL